MSKSTFEKYREGSRYEWRELFINPPRSGDEARDAARYRWLLTNRFYFADNPHTQHYHKAGIDTGWMIVQDMSRIGLSSAIDTAMAARGEGQP